MPVFGFNIRGYAMSTKGKGQEMMHRVVVVADTQEEGAQMVKDMIEKAAAEAQAQTVVLTSLESPTKLDA